MEVTFMYQLINPNLFKAMGPLRRDTLRFALIQYGGGITGVSGSIAGTVFSHNRFGAYARPRTKPVNPHSARQEQIRADLSYLAEYWHGDLSAAQRATWKVYADAVVMKNRIGANIHLTGYNHFMRTNGAMLNAGLPIDISAPNTLSLPEKDNELVCSEEGVAAQTFDFTCNVDNWGALVDEKQGIMIYQGLPQLVSRNFFAGPWRYMDYIDGTEGPLGTGTYAAVYPFGVGMKVWFAARLCTNNGRLTEPWTLAPRIIVADP